MSLGVAFRAFFAALFQPDAAKRIRQVLDEPQTQGQAQPTPVVTEEREVARSAKIATAAAKRSEALTLLATLQREARLLDLIQEPLDQFADAQIGAAAREVLKDSRKTLERMFAIQPLTEAEEGATVPLTSEQTPNRVRLVGKSTGTAGTVTHRGWTATCCEVPQWQGNRDDCLVLAPTEIEVN